MAATGSRLQASQGALMSAPFQVISNPLPPSMRRSAPAMTSSQIELQLMGALMAASQSPMTPASRASMEKAIRCHQRQAGLHHGALLEFLL
jgi:hypothetical protein